MGKLYVVGIGPGGLEHMTYKARQVIEESEVIVGYTRYVKWISSLTGGKEIIATGMKGEEERAREALNRAKNQKVSIISTGDAGIYGMAGLILQMIEKEEEQIEIEVVPGVTASSAAASQIGAPLMHDHCSISLSDLMTPYSLIKKRVALAAQGDFVISLYNPRSKGRPQYLKECLEIIKQYRKKNTPIAVVKNALREGQETILTTLDQFEDTKVDMFSIVIIGNSQSYIQFQRFITPRGYTL